MKFTYTMLWVAVTGLGAAAPAWAGDPKYAGDVVGRALSFTQLEGHVGLWTGSQVLEMSGSGMVTTSLASFKTAGRNANYYGAKGNGSSHRSAITAAAVAQQKFNPTYTAFAEYWVGGVAKGKKFDLYKRRWVDVSRQFAGKFRCDTLVNYAYRSGGPGYIRAMTERSNTEWSSAVEYYNRVQGYTAAGQSTTPKLLYGALPTTR